MTTDKTVSTERLKEILAVEIEMRDQYTEGSFLWLKHADRASALAELLASRTQEPALPDGLEGDLRRYNDWLMSIRIPGHEITALQAGNAMLQAQSALAAMRAKDAQRLDHIKKLERRIHNQRRSNRDTWEIVEARNKWLGSPEARKAFARLLVRHRATEAQVQRLTEENEALRDLADRLKLEAQGHANSTIYEIYQVLSGGKGEPGNWHGAEPAREYVGAAEARIKALEEALETVISAYDDCSGAEPSLSVLFRTIDIDARATLNSREKGE